MAGPKGAGWRTEQDEADRCVFCQRACTLFRSPWNSIKGTETEDGMLRFTLEIDPSVSRVRDGT